MRFASGRRLQAAILFCAMSCCCSGSAFAQDAPANRVLMLQNGRLVSGRISESPGGYRVDVEKGTMLIPTSQVMFEATDAHEAYRELQRRMPEKTAEYHVALARWCLTNQMRDGALSELREALKLEPSNSTASSMLQRLQKELESESMPKPVVPQVRRNDLMFREEAKSLAAFSHETNERFTRQIQPLLLNKCGNASCHGGKSGGDFHLTQLRGSGSHRVPSEKNLAALLQQINAENPELSPLLTIVTGPHGSDGRTVFHGSKGNEQLVALTEWVRAIAREQTEQTRASSARASVTKKSATIAGVNASIDESAGAPVPNQNPGANAAIGEASNALPSETTVPVKTFDQFDPARFNNATAQSRLP